MNQSVAHKEKGASAFGEDPSFISGGRDRDRTCDPYHVKVVPTGAIPHFSTIFATETMRTFAFGSRVSVAYLWREAVRSAPSPALSGEE